MHPTLSALGLPDLLEDPQAMASLTDENLDALARVRDEAADALDARPDDADLIDTVYLAHMTLSSALYLRAIMSDEQPQALPPASVLARSWNGPVLRPYAKEDTADMLVPTSTLEVLCTAGVPSHAAPDISFDPKPVPLLDVVEIPEDDEDASRDYFRAYWRIAVTENDDAICIDERGDGVVVLLDREWGYYAQQYVNASVGHFLLCLEAWRAMEADDRDDLDEVIGTFERAVERIDPAALTEGAFWDSLLASLEEDDEDEDSEES